MSIQVLINGLLLGGIYSAVGVGFSLTWGVLNIINIAHGALVMLGAYSTYFLFARVGLDPFVSIPITAVILFVFGYAIQRLLINRVISSGVFMTLVFTFGLSLFIVDMALVLFSGDYRSVTTSYAGAGLVLWDAVISYQRAGAFVISIFAVFALQLYLDRTRMGRAIRATALNRDAARLVGVDVAHIYAVTFGLGAALAGVAGALLSTLVTVPPTMGNVCRGEWFGVAPPVGRGPVRAAWVARLVLCLSVSRGRVLLRPEGSPIRLVKSPIRKMTVWPRSCSWRILFSTTVWPMCISGAVGSSPSLMRSGTPVASLRDSFLTQSACGINSSQPRSDTASAIFTLSDTDEFVTSS